MSLSCVGIANIQVAGGWNRVFGCSTLLHGKVFTITTAFQAQNDKDKNVFTGNLLLSQHHLICETRRD